MQMRSETHKEFNVLIERLYCERFDICVHLLIKVLNYKALNRYGPLGL